MKYTITAKTTWFTIHQKTTDHIKNTPKKHKSHNKIHNSITASRKFYRKERDQKLKFEMKINSYTTLTPSMHSKRKTER